MENELDVIFIIYIEQEAAVISAGYENTSD
jgi:hypothetical protein